eukprot:11814274-Karenia_brevis.AAC.1
MASCSNSHIFAPLDILLLPRTGLLGAAPTIAVAHTCTGERLRLFGDAMGDGLRRLAVSEAFTLCTQMTACTASMPVLTAVCPQQQFLQEAPHKSPRVHQPAI